MELTTGDVSFTFRLNEAGQRHVAPIDLIEWEPFRSTNTVPGREGQHVLLECAMIFDEREEEERLADRHTYLPALEYFLKHRVAITDAVMAASVKFAQDLYKVSVKYGVDRVELAQVATIDDLKTMIDLSYVQLFPSHHNGPLCRVWLLRAPARHRGPCVRIQWHRARHRPLHSRRRWRDLTHCARDRHSSTPTLHVRVAHAPSSCRASRRR